MENMTVVSESVGSFIETVRVFLPEPYETLPVRFFLELQTQDGSAGEKGREGGMGGVEGERKGRNGGRKDGDRGREGE